MNDKKINVIVSNSHDKLKHLNNAAASNKLGYVVSTSSLQSQLASCENVLEQGVLDMHQSLHGV